MSDTAYNAGPAMMAARGQTYGKRQEQMQAQQAVPMRRSPVELEAQQKTPLPPLTPLTAPTSRPQEPITAGAPFGPGPNPMAAGIPMMPSATDSAINELRIIAQTFQSPELADLLDAYESQ
jgi:hypothetical protein